MTDRNEIRPVSEAWTAIMNTFSAENSGHSLPDLGKFGSPATDFLGTQLLDLDCKIGVARFRFIALPEFANMLGNLQGGFIAAMLDETAGLTARLVAGAEIVVPTLDFRVTFLAPAKIGPLFSVGRCLHVGKRIAFMEADLLDGNDNLLSRMSVTSLAIKPPS